MAGSDQNRNGGSGRGMGMGGAPQESAPVAPMSGNTPSNTSGGPVATPPVPPLPPRPVSNQAPSWAPPAPAPAPMTGGPQAAPMPSPLNPNYRYDNPIHPVYQGASYRPGSTVKTYSRDGRPLGPYHVLGHADRVGHQPGAIIVRGRDGNAYRAIPFRRGRDGSWRNGDWHRGQGWDGGRDYGHHDGRGGGGWDGRGGGDRFHEYARRFSNVQYMGLGHLGPPRHGVFYDHNGTMSYMANGYKYIIPRGGFGYIPPHAYGGRREGGRGGHWDHDGGRWGRGHGGDHRGGHGSPWHGGMHNGGGRGGWDGRGGGRNPGPWEHSPGQQYPNHGGGGGYGGHSGGGGGGYGGHDGGRGGDWFHGRGYDDYYRRGGRFDRGRDRWDDMWEHHWGRHGHRHRFWGRHGRWGSRRGGRRHGHGRF